MRLGLSLSLTSSRASGGTPTPTPAVTPFAPSAENQAIVDRYVAVGATALSGARLRRRDRMIKRIKDCGAWAKLHASGSGLWIVDQSEAGTMINLADPGRNDWTKVGSPTFVADTRVATTTTTDYYDTGIPLSALTLTSHSMGLLTRFSSAGGTGRCGASDTGSGIFINPLVNTSTGAQFRGMSGDSATPAVHTDFWPGEGFHEIHRRSSTEYIVGHNGHEVTRFTATATALTNPTRTITIGKSNGVGTAPASCHIAAFYLASNALTADQALVVAAAVRDYVDSITYGEPWIEEVAQGDATINADVIVYGITTGGVLLAYEAARLGLSVALVGTDLDETISQVGGMLGGGGLNWIDANTPSKVSGALRQFLRFANMSLPDGSGSDSTTQLNLSVSSRAFNLTCRHAFDPRFAADAILPGLDVKIYMTGGAASVSLTGSRITALTTNDGRVFNAAQGVVDMSMTGELIPLVSGVPFVRSREAAGSGLEANNGYHSLTADLLMWTTETGGFAMRADPYVTPGVPGSGFLPMVIANDTSGQGAAWPTGIQTMNYRVSVNYADGSTTTWRRTWAPMTVDGTPGNSYQGSAPRNYDPAKYEIIGRWCASATALGGTVTLNDLGASLQRRGNNTSFYDANILETPNAGVDFYAAASKAGRVAVLNGVEDHWRGAMYWLSWSGDSRIPTTLRDAARALHLNSLEYLDWPSYGSAHWPANCYIREPGWRLDGTFKLSGADTVKAGGTTPSGSGKIITSTNYRDDLKFVRYVAHDDGSGAAVWMQGNVGGSTARAVSVPLEAFIADGVKNFAVGYAHSSTEIAQGTTRMEPTIGLAAQGLATAIFVAKRDGLTDLTAVTYSNGVDGVRDLMLAAPYGVAAYIPLTNG